MIAEFGTIDRLLKNLDRIPNLKLREKLAANREKIYQNRRMVRLEIDHDLPVRLLDLKIRPDYPAYLAGLKKYEFKSLLAEVEEEAKRAPQPQGELFDPGGERVACRRLGSVGGARWRRLFSTQPPRCCIPWKPLGGQEPPTGRLTDTPIRRYVSLAATLISARLR